MSKGSVLSSPVIYEADFVPKETTSFKTFGIAILPDVISGTVTEELNGAYSLTMKYPLNGTNAAEIKPKRILRVLVTDYKEANGDTPRSAFDFFRIYEVQKTLTGITVNAKHYVFDIDGFYTPPYRGSLLNFQMNFNRISPNARFYYDSSFDESSLINIAKTVTLRQAVKGVEGSVIDTLGGEYQCRIQNIKLLQRRGAEKDVTIKTRNNITAITYKENTEKQYTGCVATWYNKESGTTVTGSVYYKTGHASEPFENIYVYDASSDFQEEPTVADLTAKAESYYKSNTMGDLKPSISLRFVPLYQTVEYSGTAAVDYLELGDTVKVTAEEFGIYNLKMRITRTKFDFVDGRFTELTLGTTTKSLRDSIKEVK